MKLYSYYRSSASYRVRIALNLKNLAYDMVPIHLTKDGGEQFFPEFRKLNPASLLPALADQDDGVPLTQSLAIIEYLDEAYPAHPLLPKSVSDRAFIRSVALSIACEIHPVNNLRVLQYLVRELKVSEDSKNTWYRHWCESGLAAIEELLSRDARVGTFCFGDTPSLADCFLVPQVFNAQRFDCNLSAMPTIMRIHDKCQTLDAFRRAAPANQPDAE